MPRVELHRCRSCGRNIRCQRQLVFGGPDELVLVDPQVCIAGNKPGAPCEPETRADRMARDTGKRISRRFRYGR